MKNHLFRALPWKKKMTYIWDYYRFHLLFGIIGSVAMISLVSNWINYRKPLLDIIMVNNGVFEEAEEQSENENHLLGFDTFLVDYGYDVEKDTVYVDSSLYFTNSADDYDTAQVLAVMLASGGKDVFFATEEVYSAYAEDGAVMDLETILPQDLLLEYEDCLVYTKLHGNGDTYPCGIRLRDNSWMNANGYYRYSECVVGILSMSDNPQAAKDFVLYLLNIK